MGDDDTMVKSLSRRALLRRLLALAGAGALPAGALSAGTPGMPASSAAPSSPLSMPAFSAPDSPTLCQTSGAFPRQVVDTLGRTLSIARPPQRIVVIFPSNVEIVFALGLEARVAAVGGLVGWPAAALAKPSVGRSLGFSAEAVAAHQPDLIVVTPAQHSALALIDPFGRIGVPVLVLQHPDLPAILRNIRLVGWATGHEAQAEAVLGQMRAQLDRIGDRLHGAPRRRVFLETSAAGNAGFQTIGQGHYANDALAWAGGENIFGDLVGSQQVSGEAIFLRDPDVIISLQRIPDVSAAPEAARQIVRRPGWSALRAAREGRIVVLQRNHKLIPGPRQIEAVADYAHAIHPERFNA